MLDFGASPPEVTSAQMYSGPGPDPMMVAAAAWDALAAQLNSFAEGYSSVISELAGQNWTGPTAEAMAAAAARYGRWAATTGARAEQAASQVRTAAVAFEIAHAAIVPPAVVEANRSQLANLIAANTFGQNAARIAATEAHYAEMWAQDAHVMYGYAASASPATKLTPFSRPPQTANPAGQSAQGVVAAAPASGASEASGASVAWHLQALLSAGAQHLQNLSTAAPAAATPPDLMSQLTSDISTFNTLSGPLSFVLGEARTVGNLGSFGVALGRVFADGVLYAPLTGLLGGAGSSLGDLTLPGAGLMGMTGPDAGGVLARTGNAGAVGQLSVPKAWADATPVASLATAEEPFWLWEAESAGTAAPNLAGAPLPAGIPTEGMAAAAGMMIGRASVSSVLKVPPRRFKMSRPSSGG